MAVTIFPADNGWRIRGGPGGWYPSREAAIAAARAAGENDIREGDVQTPPGQGQPVAPPPPAPRASVPPPPPPPPPPPDITQGIAADGQRFSDQPQDVQNLFRAVWGANAAARWAQEHNFAIGRGPAPQPGSQPTPPGQPPAPGGQTTTPPASTQPTLPPLIINLPGSGVTPSSQEAQKRALELAGGIEFTRLGLQVATLVADTDYRNALLQGQSEDRALRQAEGAAERALRQYIADRGIDFDTWRTQVQTALQNRQLDLTQEQQRFQQANEIERLALARELGREDIVTRRMQLGLTRDLGLREQDLNRAIEQARLDLQNYIAQGNLRLGADELALRQQLGLGQIGLSQRSQDIQQQLGQAELALRQQEQLGQLGVTQRGQDIQAALGAGGLQVEQARQRLAEQQFLASLRGPGDVFTALNVVRGQTPGETPAFLQSALQNQALPEFQGPTPGARVPTARETFGFQPTQFAPITLPGREQVAPVPLPSGPLPGVQVNPVSLGNLPAPIQPQIAAPTQGVPEISPNVNVASPPPQQPTTPPPSGGSNTPPAPVFRALTPNSGSQLPTGPSVLPRDVLRGIPPTGLQLDSGSQLPTGPSSARVPVLAAPQSAPPDVNFMMASPSGVQPGTTVPAVPPAQIPAFLQQRQNLSPGNIPTLLPTQLNPQVLQRLLPSEQQALGNLIEEQGQFFAPDFAELNRRAFAGFTGAGLGQGTPRFVLNSLF